MVSSGKLLMYGLKEYIGEQLTLIEFQNANIDKVIVTFKRTVRILRKQFNLKKRGSNARFFQKLFMTHYTNPYIPYPPYANHQPGIFNLLHFLRLFFAFCIPNCTGYFYYFILLTYHLSRFHDDERFTCSCYASNLPSWRLS